MKQEPTYSKGSKSQKVVVKDGLWGADEPSEKYLPGAPPEAFGHPSLAKTGTRDAAKKGKLGKGGW